jgi:hypothetical protein
MAARRADWAVAVCAIVLVVATPIAAWWLVGSIPPEVDDLTGQRLPAWEYTYSYQAPDIDPRLAALAGRLAVVVALVAAGPAAVLIAARGARKRWMMVLLAVVVAGIIAGWGERTLTAPTIGANIGAGMVLTFGVPLILGLVGWSLWVGAKLLTPVPPTVRMAPDSSPPTNSGAASALEP